MSSMEYEYDTMGGLMPQILALTAPPGSRDNGRHNFQEQGVSLANQGNTNGQTKSIEAGLAAHPYFRRPGRGHNHDCCDSCSEGGDLICCDLCPASFHLTCHDPPLDEEELPTGEWACHQCKMGGNKDEETSNSSGRSTKGIKRKDREDTPSKKMENDKKVCAGGREFEISDSPLATLIKAASTMNPVQFSLPYEMTVPIPFPGEPKDSSKRNGSRSRVPKKKPYELDNGLVPLPARLCFQCNKSCRVGPMIPCDYCPLFFHLDCLDPPLTTPPMGRWMCPNHPEQFTDTNLLTSHSLSERVKLWDKFSVPINQDAIKLNFFQRCHRLNPPFRYKVKRALRSRIRVPPSIKRHYKDPPDLLPRLGSSHYFPSAQEAYSSSSLSSRPSLCFTSNSSNEKYNSRIESLPHESTKEGDTKDTIQETLAPTNEEKEQWLSCLVGLQSSIIKHLTSSGSTSSGVESSLESPVEQKPIFLNGDWVSHDTKSSTDKTSNHINNSQSFSASMYHKKAQLKSKLSSGLPLKSRSARTGSQILVSTLNKLQGTLKQKIESGNDVCMSHLDQCVIEALAYERLQEIMDPPKPQVVKSTSPLSTRALVCPLVPDIKLKDMTPKRHKKYSTVPIPMTYRTLTIGKGSQTDVNLEDFGHCNFISNHHASIVFDENSGHYELLNYSEYTTQVDGVSYYLGFNERTVTGSTPQSVTEQVKQIIAHRKSNLSSSSDLSTPHPLVMTNTPGHDFVRCECKQKDLKFETKEDEIDGWEGAAVLHHGSYLRFGCLKFVFSIVEDANNGDWATDTESTYQKFMTKESQQILSDEEVSEKEET